MQGRTTAIGPTISPLEARRSTGRDRGNRTERSPFIVTDHAPHELHGMNRNVTIVLDEDTARWVRAEAARRETSVSRYVGELIARERTRAEGYAQPMERFLALPPRPLADTGVPLPTRDEVHGR